MVNNIQDPTSEPINEPINEHSSNVYMLPLVDFPLLKMKTTIDLNELSFHSKVSVEKLNDLIDGISYNFSDLQSYDDNLNLIYDIKTGYLYYKYPEHKLLIESAVNLDKSFKKNNRGLNKELSNEFSKDLILRLHELVSSYDEHFISTSSNYVSQSFIDNNELSFIANYDNFLLDLGLILRTFGLKFVF
jgi:hypothetical protein